jgi:Na+/melibiose symporter-like transporter
MGQPDSLWHNASFVRFWAADTISVFGSLITRVALPFTAILVLDADAFEVSLLALADLVPSFIVGLPVGVWVDRLRRLPLMIAADLVRAVVLVSIPVAYWLDALTLAHLFGVALITSALTVLFNVSQVSLLPSLVARGDLLEANSKTSATQSISEVGAFGVSGWLVQLLSGPGAILIDAVSFLSSALFLKQVQVVEAANTTGARPGMKQEIEEGLRLVASQPVLRATAIAGTTLWFGLAIFGTLISLFALRELGFEAGPLAMIFAVGGISSLLGSLLAQPVTRRLGVGPSMILGLLIAGVLLLPLSIANGAGAFAIACLVAQQLGDGAILVFMINEVSLRQILVAEGMLGRVNATNEFLRSVARLLGVLVAGLAGEALGLRAALALGGAIATLGAVSLAMTSVRHLRTLQASPSDG